MNNNNFTNGMDNFNNNPNPNPNQTPSTPINNSLNNITSAPAQPQASSIQPQVNNIQPQNNLNNEQFINQSNNNSYLNSNTTETNNFVNQTLNNNIPQQPTINQINNSNTNTTISTQNDTINSIPQNNNVNPISQNNFQSVEYMNQTNANNDINNDEELLKEFIGKNYDKISTRPFNFAGFFFTTFYLFYRKMFLYGILLFIVNLIVLNVINNFIVTILFGVAVGFLVNKVYLYYAKKKIEKIKIQNQGKDFNTIKAVCTTKGGTSVGKIFLGFLAEIGITLVVLIVMVIAGIGGIFGSLLNPENWNITINGNEINNDSTNNSTSTKDATLVENVKISGYSCFNSKCSVSIEESNDYVDYVFNANNIDLFSILDDYSDYIKVNIYYTKKGSDKTIVDYKIYLKSNNEEITDVKNENELRNKIGLYSLGTHTESFTLTEIGTPGFGFQDDESYTYINYTVVDAKNNEYEMKYIIPTGTNGLNLTEGNNYTITFEVVEDTFGYEFYIKSVN